uniref:Uncharacterized protein n=1 Tax=Haptolina ericina TaxID=156174 RepID=A0A7S3B0G0_9EUKA
MRIGEGGRLEVTDQTETCGCCNQVRVIVETRGRLMLCDACFLGMNRPLVYECEGCGRYQRIPHPMYRYQPTPGEFGNTSWACQVRCGAQTHWRLKPSELDRVPAEDCPDSWGVRDEWLASIRAQRLAERQAGAERHRQPVIDADGYWQETLVFVALLGMLASLALPEKVRSYVVLGCLLLWLARSHLQVAAGRLLLQWARPMHG